MSFQKLERRWQLPARKYLQKKSWSVPGYFQLAFDDIAEIKFDGSRFCLTGEFVYAPRDVCASAIETLGGLVGGVTKKLSYLVIGGLGSPEWKHGSFGTKIDKAMQYKSDGHPILVVHEDRWASSLLIKYQSDTDSAY